MEWRYVPVGPDADRWVTRTRCRIVLVVVHTVTSGQRLMDVVRLLGPDMRIQVVFTAAPDVFSAGVSEFLETVGGVVVPWLQATQLQFDLALAASYADRLAARCGLRQARCPRTTPADEGRTPALRA
jgi:hypothetical protein